MSVGSNDKENERAEGQANAPNSYPTEGLEQLLTPESSTQYPRVPKVIDPLAS